MLFNESEGKDAIKEVVSNLYPTLSSEELKEEVKSSKKKGDMLVDLEEYVGGVFYGITG
jgi:hypothetical protein